MKIKEFKKLISDLAEQVTVSSLYKELKNAYKKYQKANSSLWVASLCYYSVLSITPIFAISLSLTSWLGIDKYLLENMDNFSPMKGEAINLVIMISNRLLENARSGIIAGVGFIFLGWSLISMFSLIENAFNNIWSVKVNRGILRKIGDYLAFFIFLPTMIIALNGIYAFIGMNLGEVSILYNVIGKILPSLGGLLFLTTFYMTMPNTDVKFVPAFLSSVITVIIFFILQSVFVYLQAIINTYNQIYGSLSVVIIFLIWIRIAWFIIILGGHFSYFLQNKNSEFLIDDEENLSFNSTFYIALKIVAEIVKRHTHNLEFLTLEDIENILHIKKNSILNIISILKSKDIILESEASNGKKVFLIGKNIEESKIEMIYDVISNYGYNYFEESEKFEDLKNDKLKQIIKDKKFNTLFKELGGN